ncbi:hypothetical protein PV371_12985 [Streptomyces sp. TX20-6-3]|uniref:hypothetical protein n=1 Tax=Streptomyces sp. TX20-6-3 TaxID=3028705 RepID=UPI0029B0630E|nr:hypothetical protein [Streptomyces sp. TX20-6-3]MDX2560559.1 hypothetical protein [Streptomyces sp. TX20-6-3]
MTRLLRRTTNARSTEPVTDGGETPEETADGTPKATTEAGTATSTEASAEATSEATAGTDAPAGTAVAGEPPASDAASASDAEAPADDTARRFRATWRKAVLAAAVAVLLLAGSAFFHGAHQLRSTPAARNHALTDAGATARVGGDVGEGLARIFSYTPASDDAVERSAGTVLAGRAARQYADLFAQVRAKLVEQRISLSTQTVRTGVIELDGDSARLLVFLDQTSRRDTAGQDRAGQDKATATSAAAQLTVTATFQGDRWLIVDIKAR